MRKFLLLGLTLFLIVRTGKAQNEAEVEKTEPIANETQIIDDGPKLTGNPQLDYIHDPNLPRELDGYDLSDYPFYKRVPEEKSNFTCDGRHDGFYASIPHKCQVYYHCLFGVRYDFLCANYTAFDQSNFICHFANEVDCKHSELHYDRNKELYVDPTTTPVPRPKIKIVYRDRPKKPTKFVRKNVKSTTAAPDYYYYYDESSPSPNADEEYYYYYDDKTSSTTTTTTTTTPKPKPRFPNLKRNRFRKQNRGGGPKRRRRKGQGGKRPRRKKTTTTTTTTTTTAAPEYYDYYDDDEYYYDDYYDDTTTTSTTTTTTTPKPRKRKQGSRRRLRQRKQNRSGLPSHPGRGGNPIPRPDPEEVEEVPEIIANVESQNPQRSESLKIRPGVQLDSINNVVESEPAVNEAETPAKTVAEDPAIITQPFRRTGTFRRPVRPSRRRGSS